MNGQKMNGFSWGKSTYSWEGPAHLALIALILSQNYPKQKHLPMPEASDFLIAK